jgi:hypothetical protein
VAYAPKFLGAPAFLEAGSDADAGPTGRTGRSLRLASGLHRMDAAQGGASNMDNMALA